MKTRMMNSHPLWKWLPVLTLYSTAALAEETLQQQLEARKAEFAARVPQEVQTAYAAGIQAVSNSGILSSAKQAGEKAPDFTLQDAKGQSVALHELLENGPVVLTWYRGGWCPYCNLSLRALQKVLPEFEKGGAQLVALTPELPDKTLSTAEKNKLQFQVLTDLNHQVAQSYGIVFKLTPEVRDQYKRNFDLLAYNGSAAGDDTLPLAATYIISQDGIIRYAFLEADYRARAEPAELVAFVKQLLPQKEDHPSVALLKEFWLRVWNPPHDLSAVDELLTDDFVITNPSGDIVGKAAFKEWLSGFHKKLGHSRLMPFETFASADGTRVVSRWQASGINHGMLGTPDDGKPVRFSGIAIWEVRDGKLSHNWVERSAWELHQTLTDKP
ncbi:Peroxiredoxin [Prosthecobacter debontii]|uniref:thioredoxin-dependent peroxiredoxin n=2 Tax=Prosthecobacter debontii TaxID=48467 RepID=A0A1T4X899_9BACT|nr:Peroxiredoxin [Prosthecobacter debontii]